MKLRKSCIFKNTMSGISENLSNTSVFFDIETTGLSWRTSHLYMIGCAYYDENEAASISAAIESDADRISASDAAAMAECLFESATSEEMPNAEGWILQQWFLEKPGEEKELLEQFAVFLNGHSWDSLIHYNGTTFDLPYLRNKYQFYKLEDPLACIETDTGRQSLDLFTQIRRYKKLLNTSSLKQRDLEICFGLPRDDCYTGGELISVYHEYLRSGDENLLNCLWLHNYEDVQNLLPICAGVRAYQDLFAGKCRIASSGLQSIPGLSAEGSESCRSEHAITCSDENAKAADTFSDQNIYRIMLSLSCPVPQELTCAAEHFTLHAQKSSAELTIPVYEGELRHYFADYKNYYYLPDEDMAIHKSVGSFVDPEHRKKATADTCYQRVSGQFLPQMDEVFSPALRQTRKDKVSWFRIEEIQPPENTDVLQKYVQSFLTYL